MAWFADLAGKAENLLNNLDEQTGAALRNHNISNKKREKSELNVAQQTEGPWPNKKRVANRSPGNKRSPDVKPLPLSNKPSPLTNKSSPLTNKSPPLSNKTSPTSLKFSRRSRSKSKDNHDDSPLKIKPASRKLSPNSPNNEAKDNNSIGFSQRRLSLPENLETFNENDDYTYEMQNLEVENAMLRNELNVINRELTEMSAQLRQAGDNGIKSQIKLETAELLCHKLTLERDGIALQMQQLRQKLEDHVSTEVTKYLELNTSIQIELDVLKKKAVEYEEKCKELTNQSNEKDATLLKLENELRHAQSSISNLQSDLEKSNEECRRLEKDWEAYKLRVKNMLISKDDVIKSLRDGMETTADTKELMSQIESLKEERDELSQAVETVRNESENMKSYLKQVESRHVTAERVVCALRDALREEQRARNRADAQWGTVAMELKSVQAETSQAIDSLRTALRDKENEITRLKKESSSIARSTDTSALNVADYDVMQDNTIENSKLQALTHTLVLKQSKIDKLLAENNVLKIQLEKLESKFKAEMSSASHSLVQLQDNECRHRPRTFAPKDTLSALSVRMGVMVKRYPIMGLFLMAYMICLHFWVVYILCSSTPEDILKRPTKS